MPMDLRMRALTTALRLSRAMAVDRMDARRIERARRPVPRSRLTDLVAGRLPAGVEVQDSVVPTRGGARDVRVYRPAEADRGPLPLVLNLHGGGFVLGNLQQADWLCAGVADAVPAVVVSLDYRLSPEHPYPAAVQDAVDAFDVLARDPAGWGGAGDDVSVLGDSAGGNLAAVTALAVRDRARGDGGPAQPWEGGGGPPEVRRQVLVYPAVDLTPDSPSHGHRADDPVLPQPLRDAFLHHYLAGAPADPEDPYQSPLRAPDLSGLPPALVLCATEDPLTPEGRAYADALGAAGVPVRWSEQVRMPHGFVAFPGVSRAAPQALAEVAAFLRDDVPGGAGAARRPAPAVSAGAR